MDHQRQSEGPALEQISSLIHAVAHEVRNPLTAIGLSAQTLSQIVESLSTEVEQQRLLSTRQTATLQKIPQQIEHCVTLINSIIERTLANIDPIKDRAHWKTANISQILTETVTHYPFNHKQKQLIQIDCTGDFRIHADLSAVTQVFNNLIANALYSIQDSCKGEIYISLNSDKTGHHVRFMDSANGCQREQIEKIFDCFYSTRRNGLGLGLYACKKTMSALGGDIKAVSTPGESIVFTISFPNID